MKLCSRCSVKLSIVYIVALSVLEYHVRSIICIATHHPLPCVPHHAQGRILHHQIHGEWREAVNEWAESFFGDFLRARSS